MSKPLGPYGRLARLVLRHRKITAALLGLLAVVSVVLASRLEVDSDLLSLLPADEPAVAALRELHEEEGGVNLVTLFFDAEEPERLGPYLDTLVEDFEALPHVRFALHQIPEDLAFRLGLLQLDPSDLAELNLRMQGALALGPAMNPLVAQRLMDMGPVTERIAAARRADPFGDREAGAGRLIVRPTGSSSDPAFALAMMADVEAVLQRHPPEAHGVELRWIGGAYRHNVEDREGIRRDIQRTVLVSGLLVLLVVAVAFRSLRAVVVVFTPLVLANAMNLGLVWLLYGSVNTYTSFGTAILLGLGIDFAVHLVGRYREAVATGLNPEEAIPFAWDRTGPPSTTAALTSAAGFLALSVAQFQGFAQLGVVLAMGLVLCLLAMLVTLPLLLPVLDPKPRMLLGTRRQPVARGKASTYRLAPLGLMLVVVATGLAATRLPQIQWEYDISQLRQAGLAFQELSAEEQALALEAYSPVVVSYPGPSELAADTHRLQDMADATRLARVARVVSVESVVPADQGRRLDLLHDLADMVEHPNLRYLPPPLVADLLTLREWDRQPVRPDDLPEALLSLLGADRGHHRALLFPRGNMWDLREAAALAEEVRAAVPGRPVAGEHVALGALFQMVQRDIPMVALLAIFLVSALSTIDLRKVHWITGALGTLLAGMVWAGVAVQGLGVRLSILNVVGIPILLGIGVDVIIHMLHRLAEEGPGGVRRVLSTTGVAAAISALTSILAFSSLLVATNRGVQSLGLLVVVGLTTVFLVSALLLPLAWSAGWRVTGRAPGAPRRRRRKSDYLKPRGPILPPPGVPARRASDLKGEESSESSAP